MGCRLRPIFFCNKTASRLAKAILTYFINEFYCAKNQILVSAMKNSRKKILKFCYPFLIYS